MTESGQCFHKFGTVNNPGTKVCRFQLLYRYCESLPFFGTGKTLPGLHFEEYRDLTLVVFNPVIPANADLVFSEVTGR
jgi:hypothetical protein